MGMADGGGPSRKRARAEGSSDEDAARRPPNEGEPITSTSEPAEDGSDQQPDAPPELRGATRFAMVRRLGGRVRACLPASPERADGAAIRSVALRASIVPSVGLPCRAEVSTALRGARTGRGTLAGALASLKLAARRVCQGFGIGLIA